MFVGVHRVHQVTEALEHLRNRIREVLQVFAFYCERLGAEIFFAVAQVLKAIRLEFDYFLEVVLRKRDVIVRIVVRCVSILIRAGLLEDVVVYVGGILLRATEHHVLKEVRKSGLASFDLIA